MSADRHSHVRHVFVHHNFSCTVCFSTKLEVLSRTLSQKKPVPLPSLTSQPHQVLAADLVPFTDIQQVRRGFISHTWAHLCVSAVWLIVELFLTSTGLQDRCVRLQRHLTNQSRCKRGAGRAVCHTMIQKTNPTSSWHILSFLFRSPFSPLL